MEGLVAAQDTEDLVMGMAWYSFAHLGILCISITGKGFMAKNPPTFRLQFRVLLVSWGHWDGFEKRTEINKL